MIENFKRYILLKNQPLLVKLCLFSTILVIFPVISVGYISYKRSSIELEEEVNRASRQVIDQVELHIEYYLQDFEITSLKIINSPDFTSLLKWNTDEKGEIGALSHAAKDVLKNAEYSRADISNITVIMDDGIVLDTLGNLNYYPATKIKEEYWYSSVPLTGMVMLVSRELKLKEKEQPVISLVRRLHNPETLQPVGLLIIDINFRRMKEIANKVSLSKNGYFFILDSTGHYVYHPDISKLGKKVEHKQLTLLKDDGSIILNNDRRDFVAYSHSPTLGWGFFTAVPYGDLTGGVKQIGLVITWTITISLLLAYLIGFGFAMSLIRPIRRLQQFMKDVEVGQLKGRVKVESKDEIGQLTIGFNDTVERLSKLVDEVYISKLKEAKMSLDQKETELKMLQSQINPHFLYNSLETIRGMALDEHLENIATMSSSLGKLLRYNLKNSSSTVCLEEEIKFCEMYLQIQKFRFEDSFQYKFDIPEWALRLKVVKFSLQPLVENCFVHSFGENVGKINILIKAIRTSNSSFIIQISDTGKGIHKDDLEKIRRKIRLNSSSLDGENIGIINVHQRTRYLFGPAFGLTINSHRGEGTEVSIHLPIIMVKDGEDE